MRILGWAPWALLFPVLVSASSLKKNEVAVFFPTDAWLEGSQWHVPVHGWVFDPERDSLKRKALLSVLRHRLDLSEESEANQLFQERARRFLVDNEDGRSLTLTLGREKFRTRKSGESGHFEDEIKIPAQEIEKGWLSLQARVPGGWVQAEAQALPPEGISVISDLDDTVKVTGVGDRNMVLSRTFLQPYEAVPGMAALYQAWEKGGAAFHYLSSSPWQLYGPLQEFLEANGFPKGSFYLKQFRWLDSSFFDLFDAPEDHKEPLLDILLERFPKRRFVLVGDSGEKDPEIYGETARRHPGQVAKIFIRDLNAKQDTARYDQAFQGLAKSAWRVFRDPSEILAKPKP